MNIKKHIHYKLSLIRTIFFTFLFSFFLINCDDKDLNEDLDNILFDEVVSDSEGNGGGSGKKYYLNEGFEGSVDRWTTGGSSSDNWFITNSESKSGSNSAVATPRNVDYTYIATSVNTPMYGSVKLTFYYKIACDNNTSSLTSEFSVYVSGNNSSASSELFKRSGGSHDWSSHTSTINLNSIATPPTIKFYAQTVAGSGNCTYYLDDVSVY